MTLSVWLQVRLVATEMFTPPGPMILVTSTAHVPVMVYEAEDPKWVNGLLGGLVNAGGGGGVVSTPGVLPPSWSSIGWPSQAVSRNAIAIPIAMRDNLETRPCQTKYKNHPRYIYLIGRNVKGS